jgi:hypothetical protein
MCLTNGVFKEYLDKFVIIFLDVFLIYTNSEEEHEENMRMLLKVLREHKLYTKLSNFISYQNNIHYLGHIISTYGIAVDPEKIEVLRGWPVLRNVMKVRSFMGLVGYYQRFIKGFSKIASPITSLQKKGVEFEWMPKCEVSFSTVENNFDKCFHIKDCISG